MHSVDVLTNRLDLRRPDPSSDLDELFVIFSDPEGWWYDPAGRHIDPETTRNWLTRAAARFDTDGLSYWTVRRRDTRVIVGTGGAQRQSTGAWNLNYRIARSQQGRRATDSRSRTRSSVDPPETRFRRSRYYVSRAPELAVARQAARTSRPPVYEGPDDCRGPLVVGTVG
jgi:Acetyltransferase (GNAT) domain